MKRSLKTPGRLVALEQLGWRRRRALGETGPGRDALPRPPQQLAVAPQHDAGHAVDPGAPGAFAIEARRRARDLEERGLHQIVDVGSGLAHAAEIAPQTGLMTIEQSPERREIARCHRAEQLGVAALVGVCLL